LPRPYRTPGGVATSGLALALAVVALASGVAYGVAGTVTIAATLGVFAVAAVYFVVAVRPRIAGRSLDDELAIVRAAESCD
jgi:ethanolamine permease